MKELYQIVKSAIIDVSPYVKIGLDIEDIEECIEEVILINKKSVVRPISSLLMYEVKTTYKEDKEVIILMNSIVDALDALVVDYTKNKYLDN